MKKCSFGIARPRREGENFFSFFKLSLTNQKLVKYKKSPHKKKFFYFLKIKFYQQAIPNKQ